MVMPANNTGIQVGYLAGRFPGMLGHLFSPGAQRGPFPYMPYGLDNAAFEAYKNGTEWDEAAWRALLEWARISGQPPLWVLVPDVVGDRLRTLRKWEMFHDVARRYGWPLAFAVQDGMEPSDVPAGADVVFVGGSTDWKWSTYRDWCAAFPRVHIGRVNTYGQLVKCLDAGAESVDGTGWFRGDRRQYNGLLAFLEEQAGVRFRHEQMTLEGVRDGVLR